MKFKIRKARLDDLQKLLDLFQHYGSIVSTPKKATPKLISHFKKILKNKSIIIFLAKHESKIVGSMQLTITDEVIEGTRPHASIENVIVDPNFRRQGVGTRLLQTLIKEAKKYKCYKISLDSRFTWKEAHTLYEKNGFKFMAKNFRKYLK